MEKNSQYISGLERYFSSNRLEIARKRGLSGKGAVEFHQETLKLGLSLMAIIGTIEICLRNVVVETMDSNFGSGNWLKADSDRISWDESMQNMILDKSDKAYHSVFDRLPKKRKTKINQGINDKAKAIGISKDNQSDHWRELRPALYTDADLIPHFTLNFWKQFYSKRYSQVLWVPIFSKTFSEYRIDISPVKPMKRSWVAQNLDVIQALRNRGAHHEPILGNRLQNGIKAINFFVQHFDTNTPGPNTILARLLADDIAAVERRGKILR